jgi:hypothetical protein
MLLCINPVGFYPTMDWNFFSLYDKKDWRIFFFSLDESLLDASDGETGPSTADSGHMEVDPPSTASTNADPLPQGLGSEKNIVNVTMPKSTDITPPQNLTPGEVLSAGSGNMPGPQSNSVHCAGKGFNPNLYSAIHKLRAATMLPRQLGNTVEMPEMGSLVDNNSANKDVGYYRHIYDNKMNVCFSFEPRCLMCHCCINGPHHILGDTYQPACIVLSDQNFPAALPATKQEAKCPIIIRVEDGTLGDLLASFRKTIGKVKIPVGSVILISSLSHLARVGTAAYAADLQSILAAIEEDYGNRVRAAHGVPIIAADIADPVTARALWDVLDWLEGTDKRAKYMLPDTAYMLKEICLLAGDPGGELATARMHLRLPTGFRNKETAAFMLGGCCRLSGTISAPDPENLTDLVATMTKELNTVFAVNIDATPDLCASGTAAGGPGGNRDSLTIIVAGASHVSRLAGAMMPDHNDIIDMSIGGWKLNTEAAEEMAAEIAEHLHNTSGKAVVMIQLFDNSIFFGKLPDGSRRDPYKAEGKFHVEGELDTIGLTEMKELFETAGPIFRAARSVPTLVLGPIPHYVTDGCCEEPDHVTNLEDADYAASVSGGVRALGCHLRQIVWHKRWKNVTVVNTAELMGIGGSYSVEESAARLKDVMELWGTADPVHPTKEAYNNLAKAMLDLACAKAHGGEDEPGQDGEQRGTKRPREEQTGRRPEWMAASVTAVSRRGPEGRGGHWGESRGGARWAGGGARDGMLGKGSQSSTSTDRRFSRDQRRGPQPGGSGAKPREGSRGGGQYGRRESW